MAGAGYKLFQTGDVLTAAQVNTYLNEQTVMVFANAAARTSALTSVLAEGMVSYLQDTNAVEVYNGSAWVGVSGAGDVTEVQAGTGISVASGTGPIPVVTNTMATAIDAKGDLVVGTGADTFSRLAVGGTNGHTLQVDSSTSTGVKWAAPASGFSSYTSVTPTFTNLTIGNGAWAYASYGTSGNLVHYVGKFDLGSTSSVSGNITISLPVTAHSDMYGVYVNTIQADDNGVGDYPIMARIISPGTSFDTFAINAAGTYAHSYTATGATIPFTWNNGDQINFSFVYKAA